MKTIEHLYDEIKKSEELKKEFASAMKENRIEDFTRAHGCNATRNPCHPTHRTGYS